MATTIRSGLSPAVRVQEFDLSDYVNNQVNTLTLLIGNTEMGPAFKVDIVPTEKDFVERYGGPTNDNVGTFFAASGYFARGGNLIFTRVVDRPTAVVAAVGFDAETEKSQEGLSFVDVENLDETIYKTDPADYDIPAAGSVVEQSDIEDYYASQWSGTQAFHTRHTFLEPVEWEMQTEYAQGDYVIVDGDVFAALNGGVSGIDEPTWDTTMGAETEDNDIIWERVEDESYTSIGGMRFKWGHSVQPVYYDPEDTDTFAFNVTINDEYKQEDLVFGAIGPGAAYNQYQIAILGWRDALNIRKLMYSRSAQRDTLKSNSPIPSQYTDWSGTQKHFLSKVTYTEMVNRFNYLNRLGEDIPRAPGEFGVFVLVYDQVSDAWQAVEYFRASSNENAFDENGANMFVEEVINNRSRLIRCKMNDSGKNAEFTTTLPVSLRGGTVGQIDMFGKTIERGGYMVTMDGEVKNAADIYRESDIEIDLIIDGDKPLSSKKEMAVLAEDLNAEAFAVLDLPYHLTDPVRMIEWTNEDLLLNTSYASIFHNRHKVYDKYTGIYRWVCGSGTIAGVMAKVDRDYFPWYAPAGSTRGVLNEIIDIREKFRLQTRDILYANRINPVAIIRSAITIYGQKTLLDRDSYLNRINVRRLINFCKRRCRKLAESFVFEFNDEFTRNQMQGIFDEFLGWVQNNRGIYEFLVVCNEMNNPPIVRDNNQLYCDIYIKPTPVAEFLYLRFYITRAGVDLQALATRVAP